VDISAHELVALGDTPLLDREQEVYLFRRMNYLLCRACRLTAESDSDSAPTALQAEIERLKTEALAIKNHLILANVRLVLAVARTRARMPGSFSELVSEGNMTLIRAVERFDYSLGNRFSTYVTWALRRNFNRSIPQELNRRAAFTTGHESVLAAAADPRADEEECEATERRARETVAKLLDRLDERERHIVVRRYGLDGSDETTLAQLGREMGISKERVRQLATRAEEKLRHLGRTSPDGLLRLGA
jgi:RNA polymerase primary sigma factor